MDIEAVRNTLEQASLASLAIGLAIGFFFSFNPAARDNGDYRGRCVQGAVVKCTWNDRFLLRRGSALGRCGRRPWVGKGTSIPLTS
jgi:hypothetical protein